MRDRPFVKRLIITGSNGTGKSHTAQRIARALPDLPLVSYDALRLTRDWVKRSASDIDEAVAAAVAEDAWILEGGPGLLRHALVRSHGVIWLDPPDAVRAWRLALRPWKTLGRSRAEVPEGNVDWPLQQYRFALRSLRRSHHFRSVIKSSLQSNPPAHIWHCRRQRDVDTAIIALSGNGAVDPGSRAMTTR